MTCCGVSVPWQEAKPGGRTVGNAMFEVESCSNPQCHTNGGPQWRFAPTWLHETDGGFDIRDRD